MEEDAIQAGMAKLTLKELPFKALRLKYQIPAMELEVERLQGVERDRKKSLGMKLLPPGLFPEARKLTKALASLEEARADFLEGVITPLTVADDQEAEAHYFFTRKRLAANPPKLETAEDKKSWNEAMDFTSNHSLLAKRMECALKQFDGNGMVRVLSYDQARAVDPRLMLEFDALYKQAFVPTEDELGKSAAPTRG